MKKIINQCTFLSIKQHESLAAWYRYFLICMISIALLLLSINGVQCWYLAKEMSKKNKLALENKQDLLTAQEKRELEQKKNLYAACLLKIEQSHKQNAAIHQLLTTLSTLIPENVALTQMHYQSDTEILITGQSLDLPSLDQFITALKNQIKASTVAMNALNQLFDQQLKKEVINFKVVVTL